MLLLAVAAANMCRKFKCAPNGVVDKNNLEICARKDSQGVVTVGDCRKSEK